MEEMKSPGNMITEMIAAELKPANLARIEIMPSQARPNNPCFMNLAVRRLLAAYPPKVIWRSLVRRARSKSKALSVRETAALGDRRFISVIQFENQRFLVGSSPGSVTLLAQLPDQPGRDLETDGETGDGETGKTLGQPGAGKEKTRRESEEN
jgi:flagellar biogenesis protein FliO